MGQIYLCRKRY